MWPAFIIQREAKFLFETSEKKKDNFPFFQVQGPLNHRQLWLELGKGGKMSFRPRMRLKTQDLKINKMDLNNERRISKNRVTRKLWNLAKKLLF